MENDKMNKLSKRIENSIGYRNVMAALEDVFGNDFQVIGIFESNDDTSYDFRSNINILGTSGIDIIVNNSGYSHQFQIGDGVVDIAVPVSQGLFKLPSGKRGEALGDILNNNKFETEACANNLEQVKQIFTTLKMYLENNIK